MRKLHRWKHEPCMSAVCGPKAPNCTGPFVVWNLFLFVYSTFHSEYIRAVNRDVVNLPRLGEKFWTFTFRTCGEVRLRSIWWSPSVAGTVPEENIWGGGNAKRLQWRHFSRRPHPCITPGFSNAYGCGDGNIGGKAQVWGQLLPCPKVKSRLERGVKKKKEHW